jgi:NTE family protein
MVECILAPEKKQKEIDLSDKNKRVVLLLQGGGALGTYQVGAYEALQIALEKARGEGARVDWIAGISIGAVNASVIAGAQDEKNPVGELCSFWHDILTADVPPYDYTKLFDAVLPAHYRMRPLVAKWLNFTGIAWSPFGLTNFFVPQPVFAPWLLEWVEREKPEQLGFYDTRPLGRTLDKHVNWKRVIREGEKGEQRILLGVTSVTSGELQLLDSFRKPLEKHPPKDKYIPVKMSATCVRASGALPPAFPPVQLDGDIRAEEISPKVLTQVKKDAFFDGGVSSNTLLTEIEHEITDRNTIVFLLDLWDRKGGVPQTLDEVVWRQKCIQFGSRKKIVELVLDRHQLMGERALNVPGKGTPVSKLEVCQLMYETPEDEVQFGLSDADFCKQTYDRMRKQGFHDMQQMLKGDYNNVRIAGEPPKDIDQADCFAVLHRRGSEGKHITTDREII